VIELSRYVFETLRQGEEFAFCRGRKDDGELPGILLVAPVSEHPVPGILERLEHEYSLRDELDSDWAARPLTLGRREGRPILILEDPGGEPLDRLLGQRMELGRFLRFGVDLAATLGKLHQRGLIHKDIKPANILVNSASGAVWLTGFGIASRLPRERQSAEPPGMIAGTLAYMAPEQTGRMNRSIDSRSDLYSLGVTFYEMLTGLLPFSASDPMEWVHCHIARQPAAPDRYATETPAPVSAIVMKLLAKTAEERYQTAAGVAGDLRHCLKEWEAHRRIDPFRLGAHDLSDRLLIPEKLYGREREIDALVASFDRVVASGRPELVLVSGYSGIGKSSVVNELHKVLVPPRGLFASGKFDQYKRDIPYSTLAQAFQDLIRLLLSKSDAELAMWRGAFLEALDPNARLMTDLIPELKLIIGDQRPVPELEPQQTQSRFQLVFRRFIGVFARPEHPLALFLDDLQWLDAATLDLLEVLLTSDLADQQSSPPTETKLRRTGYSDVQHLMLIGAYRDNEVNSGHPLMRKLEAIRQAGARVQQIILAPLTCEDLGRLVTDSLHCEPERVTPLARLVRNKTAGNPFFAIQFISALAEEALLTFDHAHGRWSWDLSRIQAKGYADNVVDLTVGKLNRLPVETQKALQEFACLGNSVEITTLSIVHGLVLRSQDGEGGLVFRSQSSAVQATARPLEQGSAIAERQRDAEGRLLLQSPAQPDEGGTPEEKVHSDLWEAVRLEFIVRLEGSYRFVHDRVQEAAYSLIPEELRAEAHLRIGRLLTAHTRSERREEAIFEIVNQINRGAALITSPEERQQVAELNLIAGKRAKTSTAYASALKYLTAGAALLAEDSWERRHELTFALELNRAECEFLSGELVAAEQRLTQLSARAASTVEQATIACLRMDLYMTLNQSDRAVAVCLDYLRHLGVEWPPHPSEEEARHEYELIWKRLGSRAIEELIELPLMGDPASLASLDVLTKVAPPAYLTDANLYALVVCRAVNLSLENGNSDGSCVAYENFSNISGPRFGNYKAGFRFGQLGYELVEKRGLKRFEARTFMSFGCYVMPWTKSVRAGRDLISRAFEIANKSGDLVFGAFSCYGLNTNLLASGDPLAEVQREAENGLEFAQKAGFGIIIGVITAQLGLIRTLRGLTPKFGSFDDGQFDELRFERHLASEPAPVAECFYWIRKLQARFVAGDYASAIDSALRAQRLIWTSPPHFETAEYHFYGALARAACCDPKFPDQDGPTSSPLEALAKEEHFEALVAHHRQLEAWAENCPENFENRATLVGAEIARIENRALDAERLYEQAIRSSHANRFVHNEALANELAARFYAARGFEKIAHAYLRDARYCYLRWGADGKVRQLDELYPHLQQEERAPGLTGTIGASVEHLDLATVIKVSQAVSGEIVLEKLIDTLMRTAIEHAGAERGLLILPRGVEPRIAAEATTSGDSVIVRLPEATRAEAAVPESIVHYVLRTQESVILDDASAQNPFCTDSYIRQHHARSILCLPLINQGKFVGLLYLENNLTPHVFTPTRIAVLKLVASQAAISLENTRLYRDLEEREAKIRRLVDANIIGIGVWNLEGEILEANEAFLHMVKYSREDLVSGRVRWTDLTPPEWRESTERAVSEGKATGTLQPFEKEFFRKDGTRVPVLVGGAMIEADGNEGVAFVLDLSEQKRAEEALRASEERWSKLAENSSAGIALIAPDGRFIAINPALQKMLGYTEDELQQRTISDITYEEDRAATEARIQGGHEGQRRVYRAEKRYLRKDGGIMWADVSTVFVPASGSNSAFFSAVIVDSTEQKRAEGALQKAQAELAHVTRVATLGELAASIAHEVNQPLTAIVNNANACLGLLPSDMNEPDDVREALSDIANDADRASTVLARIRGLIKKSPLQKTRLDLREVVSAVLILARNEAATRRVTIKSEIPEDLPFVSGDHVQLQQVLLNLIMNGMDAMTEVEEEQRFLLISGRPEIYDGRPAATIAVQDCGLGLETEQLDRLFDPFYTTKPEGMGMGLAISRSIIEEHSGRLWVEPKPGPGATFLISLPAG
jgi:PAS domain S-box-containing protein